MNASLPGFYSVGNGPAVVLLHCTLSSKNQWRGLSSLLENDHRVIAVDLYGYGDTPMPRNTENFTLLDEAELVHALLEEILPPDEPFHLVGHSYGGAVALRFCHRFPNRALTLTLYEPVSFHLLEPNDPGLGPVITLTQEIGRLTLAGMRSEAVEIFLDYWSGPGTFATYPPRVQKDFAGRAEKLQLDFRALMHTRLTCEDYRQLQLPVTLIAGRSSRVPALRVTEKLSQALPHCELVWVDAGHMGPVTDPALVNPIIKAAISRC